MSERQTQIRPLAKTVVALGVLLLISGVAWRGVSLENIERIWNSLLARPNGPFGFRFILQPAMAAIIAVRDGLYDVKHDRSPFAWTIISNARERGGRLREALNATAKILLVGLAIDTVYQIIVFKAFFPYEALITAALLAFIPYVIIRGLTLRIGRRQAEDAANTAGKNR